MKIKVGSYVKGIFSPFVHGQVEKMDKAFVYLSNGGVFPIVSVLRISKKEEKTLPNFRESLRNSKNGLNLF